MKAAAEAVTSLPVRYADGVTFEDHGSSVWVICYVRRVVDGEPVILETEAIVFQRQDFNRELMACIAQFLPLGVMELARPSH